MEIKKPNIEEVKSSKGFSVLKDQKDRKDVSHTSILQELAMQNDPKFIKAKQQFYDDPTDGKAAGAPAKSVKSGGGSKFSSKSVAQKFDAFIQK